MNEFIAATYHGLEPVLATEIEGYGAKNISQMNRAISFEADTKTLYELNLYSKLALRFLRPVYSFSAKNEKQIYQGIYDLNWPKYFKVQKTILVRVSGKHEKLTHSKYLAQLAKDAVVDRFRAETGSRPNVENRHPNIIIQVHFRGREVRVLLDTSGQPLFKRGYRMETGAAPINEVLAAGLVAWSEWDGNKPLIDPMCGSGTIPIEALMWTSNLKTSRGHRSFSFQHLLDYDQSLFDSIENREESLMECTIKGFDIDPDVIKMAKTNASCAGLAGSIRWRPRSFFDKKSAYEDSVLIMNPPYDERIPLEESRDFYKKIGDQLKRHCSGSTAWIFSGNLEALKFVGLKPSKKIVLFNGPLESRLAKFDLY